MSEQRESHIAASAVVDEATSCWRALKSEVSLALAAATSRRSAARSDEASSGASLLFLSLVAERITGDDRNSDNRCWDGLIWGCSGVPVEGTSNWGEGGCIVVDVKIVRGEEGVAQDRRLRVVGRQGVDGRAADEGVEMRRSSTGLGHAKEGRRWGKSSLVRVVGHRGCSVCVGRFLVRR
jgi:hypothetical protein